MATTSNSGSSSPRSCFGDRGVVFGQQDPRSVHAPTLGARNTGHNPEDSGGDPENYGGSAGDPASGAGTPGLGGGVVRPCSSA